MIRLKSIMVGFSVRDLNAALEFYTDKLGFHVAFKNGAVYSILVRDGIEIALRLNHAGANAGKGSCYIKLEDIDALHEELLAKGTNMTHPLKTESYGMKEFMVTDPEGNTLNFGEPVQK